MQGWEEVSEKYSLTQRSYSFKNGELLKPGRQAWAFVPVGI